MTRWCELLCCRDVFCTSYCDDYNAGTEAGVAPYPTWSTGTTNDGGDPDSNIWNPAECDTTLMTDDKWFWIKDQPLRSLSELVDVYHNTVGRNCQLMMDMSPDRTGLIPAAHAARYKQLGTLRCSYTD